MSEMQDRLWVPNGVSQNTATAIIPKTMRTDTPQAHSYKFTFRFQGKQKQILVVCHTGATRDEIEDRAGEAFEDWMEELNQEEHKRAPSKKEKKEIGKALNEFLLSAKRRRESSNGRLHYLGSN